MQISKHHVAHRKSIKVSFVNHTPVKLGKGGREGGAGNHSQDGSGRGQGIQRTAKEQRVRFHLHAEKAPRRCHLRAEDALGTGQAGLGGTALGPLRSEHLSFQSISDTCHQRCP